MDHYHVSFLSESAFYKVSRYNDVFFIKFIPHPD